MQIVAPTTKNPAAPADSKGARLFPLDHRVLFALVTGLFFLWGMSNNLTDILVQQFRKSFALSQLSAQLVQTANFLGYFCMAVPAALVMRRWSYKVGMVVGLITFGTGMILFWPAARSGQYAAFLVALFMVGSGASILETAANPFVAQFGPAATSERRLNFAQAFNPPGTILGVLVGARFIFSGIELNPSQVSAMQVEGTYQAYLHTELMRVVPPYIVLGSIVLVFAAVLSRMEFPVIRSEHEGDVEHYGSFRDLLQYPHLWLAVFALFCTVGAQISSWSGVIVYAKQFTPASERVAAGYLTATLVVFALGRICSTQVMKHVAPSRLLCVYAVANIGLLLVGILHPGTVGLYSIVLSSFFMSIMFPTVFAMGVKGLGANTKLAGAFLVMSLAGGAIFPALFGWIANRSGSLAMAYVAPLLGYTVLAMYAWRASRALMRNEP